jgi:purine-binding chemotaxis protein CheW
MIISEELLNQGNKKGESIMNEINQNIEENTQKIETNQGEGLKVQDMENSAEQNNIDDSSDVKQFLTFNVDDNIYAVDIMKVMEIRGWSSTTRIPNSPEYMRGVINLRGLVIPIFDLRTRFGLGNTEATDKHVVIVVSIGSRTIGILVDAVSDILSLRESEVKPSPSSSETGVSDEYVNGLISSEDSMVILLNIEFLFDSSHLRAADEAAASE